MDYNRGYTLLLHCILCLYAITFEMWADTGLGTATQEASVGQSIPAVRSSGSLCLALLQDIINKQPAKEGQ